MARVVVKNAKADRTFWDGKGLSLIETETVKGQQINTYWSVFFNEPHNIQPGTVLTIEGKLGARIDEFNDKVTGEPRTKVNLTINFPEIKDVQAGGADFLAQAGAVELDNAPF